MSHPKFYTLTEKDLLDNLINLNQLTFEVTDGCNLKCKYCGYGDMYGGYDERKFNYLPVDKAKLIIDYLVDIWQTNNQKGENQTTAISFYGGEPLLNMEFIKTVIDYIEKLPPEVNKRFIYTMTTNAMLLDRHMEYLVEKDFQLLISLDGDKEAQSYRVDHNGNNSFDIVFKNIKLLQEKHPHFFIKNVAFNSVLHNRSSVSEIIDFFKKEFSKSSSIVEVRPYGILPDKMDEFNKTYKNKFESLRQADNCEQLSDELFLSNPETGSLFTFLKIYSKNAFMNYNELLLDAEKLPTIVTGSCTPFSKKMFVSVNGKIMPCERIDHKYYYGMITDEQVILDLKKTASAFNELTEKMGPLCSICSAARKCMQCVYFLDVDERTKPISCDRYMNKEGFDRYVQYNMKYLAKHPHLYEKLMKEINVY